MSRIGHGSASRDREHGAVRKERGSHIPVALVYPNQYRVGMGNLGFQFLYGRFNSDPRFAAERFFFSYSGRTGERAVTLVSEESGRPLDHFPLIAFSIPFENDYPAVPAALLAAGIPPLQEDRGRVHPIVMAGGVAVSLNPEPLADFLDAVFVGELNEEAMHDEKGLFSVLAHLLGPTSSFQGDRSDLLSELGKVPSVNIPGAYRFDYDENGLIRTVDPAPGFTPNVRAARRRPGEIPVPVSVLFSPEAEFGDTLLVETSRGCGRGCRFCSGGWIHLPFRAAPFHAFRKDVELAIEHGRTVGLIGSDLASHPELEDILEFIVKRGGKFSLSSIRPEGLTPALIELMAKTGQKTATLAPEVASPCLKKVVAKNIPSQRFLDLVESLVAAGIPNVRFYCMIGLPTETDEDVEEIVDFVLKSREVFVNASRARKKVGKMAVQVNPFIPKPWTPFQWASMTTAPVLEKRIRIIRRGLKNTPNLVLRFESSREALFQAVLSRGDRRLAGALLRVARHECSRLDAFKEEGIDPAFYAYRERDSDEIFPWDLVRHGVTKETLRKLYLSAMAVGG